MVGAATLETVTPLPVRSAGPAVVQPAAPPRLKAVVLTAVVPFWFSKPLTASLSAAFSVTENAVALAAVVLAVVNV